ncbi:hypoxanthine phosphoribosyltransferase [Bacteriovorax sp. Seq25_V]|uniref:hypoxanthine phosphoribosyltransferase n=1 Tax=Bacteriovorax sp. Seq25_V TaxID=1201288 RepID=UPI000389F124|nr:hypoxanthine phosphoribosyltransferase [Bacteriovorax sp. Seq25_V]EQC47171.1 hypoxanthine phosphoribosyltransferase [Bacteriovorax sp. Seq25_V]
MSHKVFISQEQISNRVKELARTIDQDFSGEEIVVIGVLNGAFMFVADLIREIKSPIILDFIAASSYEGTESTGNLKILKDIKVDIKDKNVILVEDIVDTGLTIKELQKDLKDRGPKSLKLCSLLHKPARTIHENKIDYLGFEIEDKFVIGYGLDFDGKYRELPYIGVYGES